MGFIYVYTWRWHLISSSLTFHYFLMLSSTEVLNMEKAPQVLCCTCVSFWLTFETVSHITFCPLHTFPVTCPGARHGVTDEYKQWSVLFSVQFSSVAQSCLTLCDPMNPARQAFLSITNSWSSLRLTCIESVMPSSHLILCHPLLLLPPIPPSIRVFSNESTVTPHL